MHEWVKNEKMRSGRPERKALRTVGSTDTVSASRLIKPLGGRSSFKKSHFKSGITETSSVKMFLGLPRVGLLLSNNMIFI